MKIKKLLALTLALVLAMSVFAACGKKEAEEKLVIGYTIYEPMNYMDETGALTGFDTEFAEAVCEKLGVSPEDCVMIGNDTRDDMVAETIGMKVFLLEDCIINKSGEDISVYPHGSFDELINYVRELTI